MHEEACKIAKTHIDQLWKANFRKKLDGYPYYLVDQYIYVCFLIKRTYDINVFEKGSKYFALAYLAPSEEFRIDEDLNIMRQAYCRYPVTKEGYIVCSLFNNEHREVNFLYDGRCSLFIDPYIGEVMITRYAEGFSALEKVSELIAHSKSPQAV